MQKISILILALVIFASCTSNNNTIKNKVETTTKTETDIIITAAGATFPFPFYKTVFDDYNKQAGIKVTYSGIGSGGGTRSIKDKVVDFGAVDGYLSDKQLDEMDGKIVHIPTCVGAVAIAYNLDGIENLKLSGDLLEKIFLGEIDNWNNHEIAKLNRGINLPNKEISVIYRSEGSGTTFIFSDYMSKISEKWHSQVGRGKSLNWPVGTGAKGNAGVAGTIATTEGAIGYIGSEYASSMSISTAAIQNSNGNYIKPNLAGISAAAKAAIPTDTRVMLTNSSEANSYPISGFTWIILYKEQAYGGRTKQRATEIVKLLNWMLSNEAQALAQKTNYAPLPQQAIEKAKSVLKTVTYNGEIITE